MGFQTSQPASSCDKLPSSSCGLFLSVSLPSLFLWRPSTVSTYRLAWCVCVRAPCLSKGRVGRPFLFVEIKVPCQLWKESGVYLKHTPPLGYLRPSWVSSFFRSLHTIPYRSLLTSLLYPILSFIIIIIIIPPPLYSGGSSSHLLLPFPPHLTSFLLPPFPSSLPDHVSSTRGI